MTVRPTGTATFLITDIEGSTRRWAEEPDAMRVALLKHDDMLKRAVASNAGWLFKNTGDGALAVFDSPKAAIDAAIMAQRELELPVRMAICTGEAERRDDDYFGPAINRAARTMAAGHGGQILVAASTAAIVEYVDLLDLGEHRLRDLSQPQRLFQVQAEGLRNDFPPLNTLDQALGNLPAQTTSFLGREGQLAEIGRLLEKARLVTLAGVGGVGKTRLAVQVAAEVSARYPDGTWLVELASLRDSSATGHSVAGVLGIVEQPGRTIEQSIASWLGKRRILLILDNCEHLIDAVADLLGQILARCPNVVVLATSREALMLDGELTWPVPSLSFREGASSPAAALFMERARAVAPDLVVDADDTDVMEICRRLDGIPLAIELAAARTRSMSVSQIRSRLEERFRLLTGGSRRALERHQSLRQTVQWSFDLLTPAERDVLARASVFAGEFTLEDAEHVCASDDVHGSYIMDHLDSLVRKSLMITARSTHAVRYSLLETIRQFGEEQLAAVGEGERMRARHARYFSGESDKMFKIWRGPGEKEGHAWLEREIANLRAAFRWASENGQIDCAAMIASNVGHMGRFQLRDEVGRWATEIVDLAREVAHPRLVVLLTCAAANAWAFLQFQKASRYGEEALALVGDPRFDTFVWAFIDLAIVAAARGDTAKALDLLRTGAAHPGDQADRYCLANLHYMLTAGGRRDEALDTAAETLELVRKVGFPNAISVVHAGTGRALADENPVEALAAYEEGISIARAAGARAIESMIFCDVGALQAHQGDPVDALRTFSKMLTFWNGVTGPIMVSAGLANLVVLLDRLGYSAAAATLHGNIGKDLAFAAFAPELSTSEAHLRSVLGRPAFEDARRRGADMSAEDAIAFADSQIRQALTERSAGS